MKRLNLHARTMIVMASLLLGFTGAASAQRRAAYSSPLIDISLPLGSGAIRGAYVRRHANGVSQETVLGSDGGMSNYVDIAIQTGPVLSFNKVPVWKPTAEGIHSELASKFPGIRMQVISDRSIQNQYGVIGVAYGGSATMNCVYAWQYYDDARSAFSGGEYITTLEGDEAPAALRLRYCSSAASVNALIGLAEQISINIPADFNTPGVVSAGRAPGYVRASRPHARYARKRNCNCGPKVAKEPKVKPEVDSYSPPTADGLRFMAPVEGQSGGGGEYRAAPALSTNLPARAYRGPDWEQNQGNQR